MYGFIYLCIYVYVWTHAHSQGSQKPLLNTRSWRYRQLWAIPCDAGNPPLVLCKSSVYSLPLSHLIDTLSLHLHLQLAPSLLALPLSSTKHLFLYVSLHVYMCVSDEHICVYVWVHALVWACACGGLELTWGVFLDHLPLYFLMEGLWLNPELVNSCNSS